MPNSLNNFATGLLENPLFQIGQGILANSGPSLRPVNPWRGVNQGLLASAQARAYREEQLRKQMEMQQAQAFRQAQMDNMLADNDLGRERLAFEREQWNAKQAELSAIPPYLFPGKTENERLLNIILKDKAMNGASEEDLIALKANLASQILTWPREVRGSDGNMYRVPGLTIPGLGQTSSSTGSPNNNYPEEIPFGGVKPATEGQRADTSAALSLGAALEQYEKFADQVDLSSPKAIIADYAEGPGVGAFIAKKLSDDDVIAAKSAADAFSVQYTKLMSGTAARPDEFIRTYETMFTRPGDGEKTKELKRQRRKLAVQIAKMKASQKEQFTEERMHEITRDLLSLDSKSTTNVMNYDRPIKDIVVNGNEISILSGDDPNQASSWYTFKNGKWVQESNDG